MDNHFRNRGLSLYSEFNLLNLRVTGPNASYAPTHTEIEGEGEDVTKLGHFKQKGVVDLRGVSPGNVQITYKVDVSIVGKLAMFGDRVMRAKAKDVEKEFTKELTGKASRCGLDQIITSRATASGMFLIVSIGSPPQLNWRNRSIFVLWALRL